MAGKSTHILVVDDEPMIRELLRKLLESEDYTVDLAVDGREAWQKLHNVKYDCILLDLIMNEMGGQELYELIHESNEALASRVVFLTGDTVRASTLDFISRTGNPMVAKPFRFEELIRAIQDLWE